MIPEHGWRARLRRLNLDGAHGAALLAVLTLLFLVYLTGDAGRQLGRYERTALAAGEHWRWISAHWVHLGRQHLLFNATGLALLWLLFARVWSPWRWLLVLLVSTLVLDAGLWYLTPEVGWYVGASGLLHGGWAAGAIGLLQARDWRSSIPALALLAKLLVEHFGSGSLMQPGLAVVEEAHLFGAVGGSLLPLWWRWRQWREWRTL
jgi:rhomboid family GlyGly-CTERM serine protease